MNHDDWLAHRTALVRSRIPAQYRDLDLEAAEVRNWCRNVLVGDAWTLVLQGPKGTGKTGHAWLTWPHLIGRGWIGSFRGMTEVDYLEACFSDKDRAAEAKACGVLLLDDLGSAPASDWSRSRLLALIDSRWLARKPLIVTTNLTQTQLTDHLGDRALSRLADGATVVTLTGSDRRLA